ncbi:MAG: hypothetical protein L0H83_06970 [Salinisphaera sp.]|nr:hypothetical protein [Salinisphaera sp.]
MWWQILLTAVISAGVTLIALALAYRIWVAPVLEARLKAVAEEIETRVRSGVTQAGEDLLPAYQERVRDGFRDAVSDWPTRELRQGLSSLFGDKRRRDPDA